MRFQDIERYLPKYLSPSAEQELFEDLKQFPKNINKRLYTSHRYNDPVVYQGDGIRDLLVVNLPNSKIGPANSMILSNTCDIDPKNIRPVECHICYAPIFNLKKYRDMLSQKWSSDVQKVDSHIAQLRKQAITNIIYLPVGGKLSEESFIFLDRINNCVNGFIDRSKLKDTRLFTLSNYGLYLFCFKLSLHFTRINEGIDRDELVFHI